MRSADIILKSRAIFTGYAEQPFSGCVVIAGNRIEYVGSDEAILNEYVAAGAKVYDMGDRLIMPGLHDAHLHFYMSGLYASPYVKVSFTDTSEKQCVDGMRDFAETIPKERWLIGAGWYHPLWDDPVLPTKYSLDEAFPDRPVCMVSTDCHTLWVNSEGLKRLHLTENSVPPEGGSYGRMENGELSGTIHEAAAFSLIKEIYQFSAEEEDLFYTEFIKCLNDYGITSVCDMSMMPREGADFVRDDIYERLLETGKLTVRVSMYPTLTEDLSRVRSMRAKYTGQVLRCQGVKQFMDGVSPCHTAYLKEDYANAAYAGERGRLTVPEDRMRRLVQLAVKEGLSVRVHTIGDQAIHLMLDIIEETMDACADEASCQSEMLLQGEGSYFEETSSQGEAVSQGWNPIQNRELHQRKAQLRHVLEHLENFQAEDIPRMAQLGVIPSVQPPHAVLDPNGVERDLGPERIRLMWPFRSLIDSGCTLAFGTDSPVVEVNPFYGIYNAVTRRSAYTGEPEGGWMPHERITLAEALSAYTYGAACASLREGELGTLESGKLADVIVLDCNPFQEKEERILTIKPVVTIMDGKVIKWEIQ